MSTSGSIGEAVLLSEDRAARSPIATSYASEDFAPVRAALAPYEPNASVNLEHPYFARALPRTMLIDEMEAIWAPIAETDDWTSLIINLAEIEEMRDAYMGDQTT